MRSSRLLREFVSLGFVLASGPDQCVLGHPETPLEMAEFTEFARPIKLFAAVMITPSDVIPDTPSTPCSWANVLCLDSALSAGF